VPKDVGAKSVRLVNESLLAHAISSLLNNARQFVECKAAKVRQGHSPETRDCNGGQLSCASSSCISVGENKRTWRHAWVLYSLFYTTFSLLL